MDMEIYRQALFSVCLPGCTRTLGGEKAVKKPKSPRTKCSPAWQRLKA